MQGGRKINAKAKYPCKTLAILLIILSNDVHPNPGPKPLNPNHCAVCVKEVQEDDHLECDTCKKRYHFKCSAINESKNRSFDWICPSVNCKPNHREVDDQNYQISPNRFQPLETVANEESFICHTSAKPLKKASPSPRNADINYMKLLR